MKPSKRDLHGVGIAQKDRKGMPEIPIDRKMEGDDFDYLYSDKVAYFK